MNKTLNVSFLLRRPWNYESGPMPIYLRLTVDGKRIEMNTNRHCEPEKWDSKSSRIIGTKEETKQFNNYLDALKSKVFEAQRTLLLAGKAITSQSIKDTMLGKRESQEAPTKVEKTLLEIYRAHVNEVDALVGKDYAAGTLKRYKAALSSLEAFLKHKSNEGQLVRDLKHQFVTDYEFYLKSVRNVDHNTAMGIIKKLKKIVKQCVHNELIDRDPFANFKIRIRDVTREFLTQSEIDKIIDKQFQSDRISQVRDIFIFSCYTGLAFVDIQKLTPANVVIGLDGKNWIETNRQKTGTPSRIPLLPIPAKIVERYRDYPVCMADNKLLPVRSNDKTNEYLAEIRNICGINKAITFHSARHTFATTVTLTNGVPIETLSKMLGHKNLRTTQIYGKIVDAKVSEDMLNLEDRLRKNNRIKR